MGEPSMENNSRGSLDVTGSSMGEPSMGNNSKGNLDVTGPSMETLT